MKFRFYAIKLSVIIIIIFILQKLVQGFTDLFILNASLVLIRPYTLLTSIFLHSNIGHLLYNLFALALFGSILEKLIGYKKFLLIFFLAGLLASFTSIFFYNAVLGASGAIFGILGTLTYLKPKMVVWVFNMPMPMFVAAIIWALLDIIGVFSPNTGIANLAHLTGLFVGLIFGYYISKEEKQKIIAEVH